MNTRKLSEKVKWLILIRLLMTTVFFTVGNIVYEIEQVNFYLVIAFVYFVSILYSVWYATKWRLRTLAVIQLLVDIAVETVVVMTTGGADSLFIMLYILTIASAAMVISARVGIATGIGISCVYLGTNIAGYFDVLPVSIAAMIPAKPINEFIYTSYVHVISFVLISILVSSLINRLSQMERIVKMQEHLALVGEVSAEIAHEIRNPLTTISGSVELLHERIGEAVEDENKVLMDAIVNESDRISKVFDQFLDYARVSDVEFKDISLSAVLRQVVLLYEGNKRFSGNILFEKEFQCDDDHIKGDAGRLTQVFNNIIHNAVEEISAGGRITIFLTGNAHEVCVEVRDTGKGMRAEKVKEVFERYTSEKQTGVGVGLAIAQKIVDMHEGRIEVESAPEKGCMFRVVLPRRRR